MIDIFRNNRKKEMERKFTTFSEQLGNAFAQIKSDITDTNKRIEENQKELGKIARWIEYLHRSNQQLTDSHSGLNKRYEKLSESNQKLHTYHSDLASNHFKTAETTENLRKGHQDLHKEVLAKSEHILELHKQLRQHKEFSENEIKQLKTWVDYLSTFVDRQKRKEDDMKQELSKVQKGWFETSSRLNEALNRIKSENGELKTGFFDVRKELDIAKKELDKTKSELERTNKELEKTSKEVVLTGKELESTKNMAKSHILEAKSESVAQIPAPQPVQLPQQIPLPAAFPQVSAQASFQRHIIQRVMPNRRGYVLSFILNLIKENKYSTKELEEIVVNEKQICGRTSFYAYLKELKLKGRINYAEIDERAILVSTDTQQKLQ